jgi:hypothetical protein
VRRVQGKLIAYAGRLSSVECEGVVECERSGSDTLVVGDGINRGPTAKARARSTPQTRLYFLDA